MHINQYLASARRKIELLYQSSDNRQIQDTDVINQNLQIFNEHKQILETEYPVWLNCVKNIGTCEQSLYQFCSIFNGCNRKIDKPFVFNEIIVLVDQLSGVLNQFAEDRNPEINVDI